MKIRVFDLLVSVYVGCIAISELMGAKTVPICTIGHLHLTASVALLVVPLIFTINDVIVEVYGKERARSVVFSGLVVILLLLSMSVLATHLTPSARFAPHEAAYDIIFSNSARIAAASLTAFALAELLDVWVFSKLRESLGKKALWLRNNVSNFAAQFVDTTVFLSLAFYALGKPLGSNVGFLVGIIIPYRILKCLMSILDTPLVYLGVSWLQRERSNES